ncbi:MAG: hypothetical protein EZS28_004016 [Streblomastix strix]|uniref:Uncharacterized protein n=1 Tax=Streblomastix strix TaxID=222440 RepID=A0A5J4X144_9EUKA|nr:MAG: hypothetical protein EZS28_004016 [Streblomastix strix]
MPKERQDSMHMQLTNEMIGKQEIFFLISRRGGRAPQVCRNQSSSIIDVHTKNVKCPPISSVGGALTVTPCQA